MATPFCELERNAWAPPEQITGTEWAIRHRVIASKAAEPGPWRLSLTPWARGIIDALTDDWTIDVSFMKPVQCGGTTIGENAIGAWIDLDPAPIMIVFSNEEVTKKRIKEDIVPLLRGTPRLKAHFTARAHDVKSSAITLRSCVIHTGWAGSAASLASVPIRYLVLDEVDKYPRWSGKEADAISLGEARTTTFRYRKKIYRLSTPTIPTGPISKAMESAGDVRDWCPKCPHCEAYIRPDWENVHWEGMEATDENEVRATLLSLESLDTQVFYECQSCKKDIDSAAFWRASRNGGWVSVGKSLPDDHPRSRSVGFRLSGLCTDWTRIQGAAIAFMKARSGGLEKMQHFYNSVLGVPFWGEDGAGVDESLRVDAPLIWHRARESKERGVVPMWANAVVAGIDPGKRDYPYVVRAFGPGFKSHLLEYGVLKTGDEVMELLAREWPGEDARRFQIRRACIDTGGGRGNRRNMTRTEETYRLAHRDPARLWAIKGHNGVIPLSQPIVTRMINYRPPGERHVNTLDVRLSMIDVGYWKDLLATRMTSGLWFAHNSVGKSYVMQVASEHKVLVRQVIKPDGTSVEEWRWVIRVPGTPNHFWDCEVYAEVAAHMIGADEMVIDPFETEQHSLEDGGSSWTQPSDYTRYGGWN